MARSALILTVFLLLLSLPLAARAASTVVVFAEDYQKPVAVKYMTRADYIGRTITITSDERDFSAKLRNIQEAKKYLMEETGRRGQMVAHEGPTILQHSGGFFKSSYGKEPMAQVHLLLPVVRESDNLYSGGIELIELMKGLDPPGKAEFDFSPVRLAVEDPETSRGALLELVSKDIKVTRDRLKSSGKMIVSGLEGSVRVSQFDEINVVLFIEYEMAMEVQ